MGIRRDLRLLAYAGSILLAACAGDGGQSGAGFRQDTARKDDGSNDPSADGSIGGDGDFADGDGDSHSGGDADSGVEGPKPLLGSAHGGHLWAKFCKDQPDTAKLPQDPRRLVRPGVNQYKAVLFNAYWVDCDEARKPEDAAPEDCGEYRRRVKRAEDAMEGGRMVFFGGEQTDAIITFSADSYNDLWWKWGFWERPKDFDQLVAERWGMPLGQKRNPYPLKGEDPNKTNGGSGQLPIALTQLRDADGKYSGKIGMNCHWCHSGKVGEESDGPGLGALYGSGNPLAELGALFGDYWPNFPIAANKVRGSGDILLYPAIAALDYDRWGRLNESLISAPSQGSVDYPAWWNMGHRTRRFHDGSFAMDNARPVMGFFMPIATVTSLGNIFAGRDWIEKHDQDLNLWVEAMESPKYPGPIDRELAEEGAVIFHTKNLWAYRSAPAPEGGNGSCASCHGAYSPRYAHDQEFLDQPEFEGIAAYIAPLEVIGTDPARANSLSPRLQESLKYSWWGYGEPDKEGKCFGVPETPGYLAPPLYGIWASAPYFHNGSVPTVYEVLKPSARPAIWKRKSNLVPSEWPTGAASYDTDLRRAYDHEKLGWKYETFECSPWGGVYDCNKEKPEESPAGNVWFSWNIELAPMSWEQLEERKVYNTHKYSQGNQGHEFGDALSDGERMAVIEYLKTL